MTDLLVDEPEYMPGTPEWEIRWAEYDRINDLEEASRRRQRNRQRRKLNDALAHLFFFALLILFLLGMGFAVEHVSTQTEDRVPNAEQLAPTFAQLHAAFSKAAP